MAKTIYGKDYLANIPFPHLKNNVSFFYWDLWLSIVIENKCDGELGTLKESLNQTKKQKRNYRTPCEELLSELAAYEKKLKKYQLTPPQILKGITESKLFESDFIKQQQRRAVRKILSFNFSPKDKTVAMENTPRKIKSRTAVEGTLHSFWNGVEFGTEAAEGMPADYSDIFRKKFKKVGFYTKHQTFALEEKLQKTLDKLTKKASIFELFAIYRGFLTIVIQKTEQIDDSFGNIGQMAEDIFGLYIDLDRTLLATPTEDFYIDILSLMIWEDYGYFDSHYEKFFKELPAADIETVEYILTLEKEDLQELEFDYQEKVTLSFLAHL